MSRKTRRYTRPHEPRPSQAGKFFLHAALSIQPGDRVIACCRVSRHPQQLAGNLDDQEANLRAELDRVGAIVVGCHARCWSGADPGWLVCAVDLARELGAKWLAFESVDRAIRSTRFNPITNEEAVATESDLAYLCLHTDGFPLATILPPNSSPREIRAYQRARGQRLKGHSGGRPKRAIPGAKKTLRERWLAEVLQLHRLGDSYRTISSLTGLPVMTVFDWIRKHG